MKVPKKQQHKVEEIEREDGLIDDCTHMVYLKEGYEHAGFGSSFAVKNQRELNEFLNETERVK